MKKILIITILFINTFISYSQNSLVNMTITPILPCSIEIPKHFNPNVSYRDLVEINTKNVTQLYMEIYNNWGQKIMIGEIEKNSSKVKMFETTIENNSKLTEGNYEFEIHFVCINGEEFSQNGRLKLIKDERK